MKPRKTRRIVVPRGYSGDTAARTRTRIQVTPRRTGVGTAMTVVFWAVATMSVGLVSDMAGPFAGWTDRALGGTDANAHGTPVKQAQLTTPQPAAEDDWLDDGFIEELLADVEWEAELGEAGNSRERLDSPGSAPTETQSAEALRERLALLFDDYYQEHLQRLGQPVLGETYKVTLRDGHVVEGVLTALDSDNAALRVKHGTLSLPFHRLNSRSLGILFPERKARQLAIRDMRRRYGQTFTASAWGGRASRF